MLVENEDGAPWNRYVKLWGCKGYNGNGSVMSMYRAGYVGIA